MAYGSPWRRPPSLMPFITGRAIDLCSYIWMRGAGYEGTSPATIMGGARSHTVR
jgi:hypothetical protein